MARKKTETVECIYCGAIVDPSRGEGDHIIPKAFGEFRHDTRFRRICTDCNTKIGRSESVLIRCGPESFYRARVFSQILPDKTFMFSTGAEKLRPPKLLMDHPDLGMLISENRLIDDASPPVDQISIRSADGSMNYVRLFPEMTPASLTKQVVALDVSANSEMCLSCDDTHWERYKTLIEKALRMKIQDVSTMAAGRHTFKSRISVIVNELYFRALAKIAFHYYLVHRGGGIRGDEADFAPIRDFIMNGTNPTPFVRTMNLTKDESSIQAIGQGPWCHILSAAELNGLVTVCLRLFWGPHLTRIQHVIHIAARSTLLLYKFVTRHVYIYDEKAVHTSKVGQVCRLL